MSALNGWHEIAPRFEGFEVRGIDLLTQVGDGGPCFLPYMEIGEAVPSDAKERPEVGLNSSTWLLPAPKGAKGRLSSDEGHRSKSTEADASE